jgi:hypothetical protein
MPALASPAAERGLARSATSVLGLLAAAVTLSYLGFMLAATSGHAVPQVVDLYVVCQYARSFAEGHPFAYNAGEPASTGSTSLLYTAFLGLAHAVGFRREGLVAFAIATGAVFYVVSVLLARRIGARLGDERAGFLAGALVALGGPVVWGFLYGSDIGLFMLLTLWLLDRLLAAWTDGPWSGVAAAGVLLALARPEGLVIGVLLGAASYLRPWPPARGRARLLPWLPALAGLLVLALYRVLTGLWLGTSIADKSLFANYGLADGLAQAAEYAVNVIRGLLLGFYPEETPVGFARGWAPFYFPPLALVFVLLALVRPPDALRVPLLVWTGIAVAVAAFVVPNMFMGVHFNRYLMWTFPALLCLAAVGLREAARLFAPGDPGLERSLFHAGAGLFVVLGLLSTVRMGALYGDMAGDVYRRDVATAEWIVRNLPRGVPMANIATSLEYLTGHRNLNLHGVTSPAFFGNRTAEREAGVFEALGRLPAADRPAYLITSVSVQEGSEIMKELVAGPPLYQSNSFSDELLVYRMRYDLVGKNGRLFLPETLEALRGLTEVDRLNVCDSRDEAEHGYRFSSHLGNLRLHGAVRIDAYPVGDSGREVVADAGRPILGRESFRVRTRKDHDLTVVMRTTASVKAATMRAAGAGVHEIAVPEAGIVVTAGGRPSARLAYKPRPGWNEFVFRIPGSVLDEGETSLVLSGRYAPFHYWFFQ